MTLQARLRPVSGEAAALEARWLQEAAGGDAATLERFVLRRLAGEPVDRIIGSRGFWTLDLIVSPDVLSPRPDTETVVRAALDRRPDARRILDLGTGSGAIMLALLAELPHAEGLGVDISPAALRTARENAARNGLSERAAFLCGGWDAAIGRRFDLVVSNPPYIPTGEIAGLDREVRDHDPHLALDGGADGLDCYRDILALAPRLVAPGGFAIFEIGFGQDEQVRTIGRTVGLAHIETRSDFGGVPRAIVFAAR